MNLTVSGNKKEYADGLSVARLIEIEKVETPEYVSVSINDEFIKSGTYAETVLNDGDSVEFLYFMGGGRYGFHE
jgi:sulfur carrier protein